MAKQGSHLISKFQFHHGSCPYFLHDFLFFPCSLGSSSLKPSQRKVSPITSLPWKRAPTLLRLFPRGRSLSKLLFIFLKETVAGNSEVKLTLASSPTSSGSSFTEKERGGEEKPSAAHNRAPPLNQATARPQVTHEHREMYRALHVEDPSSAMALHLNFWGNFYKSPHFPGSQFPQL